MNHMNPAILKYEIYKSNSNIPHFPLYFQRRLAKFPYSQVILRAIPNLPRASLGISCPHNPLLFLSLRGKASLKIKRDDRDPLAFKNRSDFMKSL